MPAMLRPGGVRGPVIPPAAPPQTIFMQLGAISNPATLHAMALRPVQSNIREVSVGVTDAVVGWDNDRVVQGWVEYGLTTSYGSETAHEESFDYSSHEQSLSGLTEGTDYHWRPISVDAAGLQTTGPDQTFTTGGGPEDPPAGNFPPIVDPLTANSPAYDTDTKPAYLGVHACSPWGTEIRRISNAGVYNAYGKRSAWNMDETLMMLMGGSGGKPILDGQTYAVLNSNQAFATNGVWWHTDPLKMWVPASGALGFYLNASVNASTGVVTSGSLTMPSALSGTYSRVLDGNEQDSCDDDSKMAFAWVKSGGAWGISVMTRATATVTAELQLGTGATVSEAGLLAKCDFVQISDDADWVAYGCPNTGTGVTRGVWTISSDLDTGTRTNATAGLQHVDWAKAADESPRLICWDGNIISHNPSGGAHVTLLSSVGGDVHVSGRNWQWPGWTFITQYSGGTGGVLRNKVVALDIGDPGAGRVFSSAHRASGVSLSYEYTAKGCPSPTGTRVVWNGPWEVTTGDIHAWVSAETGET